MMKELQSIIYDFLSTLSSTITLVCVSVVICYLVFLKVDDLCVCLSRRFYYIRFAAHPIPDFFFT